MERPIMFIYDAENVKMYGLPGYGFAFGQFKGRTIVNVAADENGAILLPSKEALKIEAQRIVKALRDGDVTVTISDVTSVTDFGRVFSDYPKKQFTLVRWNHGRANDRSSANFTLTALQMHKALCGIVEEIFNGE